MIALGPSHFRATLSQFLATCALTIGVVACQFYLLESSGIPGVTPFETVSIHNALLLIPLSVATLLCNPTAGPMETVCSPRLGGRLARRLIPAIIIILVLLGWLRLAGEFTGLYGSQIGAVLAMTTGFILVAVGVWFNARHYNEWEATREAEQTQANQSLRESEERLTAIIQSAMDAIVTFDDDDQIVSFNEAAERMFLCDSASARTLPLPTFIPGLSTKPDSPFLETADLRPGRTNVGTIGIRRDGKNLHIEASISHVQSNGGRLHTAILRDVTAREEAEQRERQLSTELRSLALRLQSVREEERIALARELHDVLAPDLTSAKLDAVWIAKQFPTSPTRDDPAALDRLADLETSINSTITTVQRIATDLRPPVLDRFGLPAAVKWQVERFQEKAAIKCHTDITDDPSRFTEEQATAIFRILQESLTNVARHAEASRVHVSLQMLPDSTQLTISDNGHGIPAAHLNDARSIGLLGMRERANGIGATISIRNNPDAGTTVAVALPFRPIHNSPPSDAPPYR